MSDKQDYDACYEAFMAISDSEVKTPDMPIGIALQENEDLYRWCLNDKVQLKAAGLPQQTIDALPIRTGASRVAQSFWERERFTPQEAQKEWEAREEGAYNMRDMLLHSFKYAFRNDEKLLARLSAIAEGKGDADMIQDLSNLAALGENNLPELQKINFDITQLESAATAADELASLLARANGEKNVDNSAKIIRDRAYTYMKQAADEIKDCGRYVFWKNEARLKGYRNKYKNKKSKSGNDTDITG